MVSTLVILGIALALLFNFVNGLNDAANSIATIVATRALSPLKSVILAAFFNMVGPLVFTTAIAKTIGKGIVDPTLITTQILLVAMIGAVAWVFLASWFGIPVSSSHALIGGLLGSGIAAAGFYAILWPSLETVEMLVMYMLGGGLALSVLYVALSIIRNGEWKKNFGLSFIIGAALIVPILIISGLLQIKGILAVVIFIMISPMLGLLSAYLFGLMVMRVCEEENPGRLNNIFKRLQIIAGSFQAIGHGANDAQNAMGMITAMLVAGGILGEFTVPFWVIIASCAAISLGTFLGGWRVVEKMAYKITKIRPYQGFCASTAGGGVLSLMTVFGVPVSTTHAMTGAIMGVGATRGYSAVKWGIVREIVAAWIFTIPAAAVVSWLCYRIISFLFF